MDALTEAGAWFGAGVLVAGGLVAAMACGDAVPDGAVGYTWEPELVGDGLYADDPTGGRAEVVVTGKRVFDDGPKFRVSELTVGATTVRIVTEDTPLWREMGSIAWEDGAAVVRYDNGTGLSESFAVEVRPHAP